MPVNKKRLYLQKLAFLLAILPALCQAQLASPGICLDANDPAPACQRLEQTLNDLATDIDAIENRNREREAERLRHETAATLSTTTPTIAPSITLPPPNFTSGGPPIPLPPHLPLNEHEIPLTLPDARQRPPGHGEITLAEQLIRGRVLRPDHPALNLVEDRTLLRCFDENIFSLFERFQAQHKQSLSDADKALVRNAYQAMLICLYPCMSAGDARFLMECSNVNRFITELNAPSVILRSLYTLPLAVNGSSGMASTGETPWCSVDAALQGFTEGQFTATTAVGSGCAPLVLPRLETEHEEVATAFQGVDIAILLDNSGSMSTVGPIFAREIFPEFLRVAGQLPVETKLILFTQSYSGATDNHDFNLGSAFGMGLGNLNDAQSSSYSSMGGGYGSSGPNGSGPLPMFRAPLTQDVNVYRPLAISSHDPAFLSTAMQYVTQAYRQRGDGRERHTRATLEHLAPNLRPHSDLFLIIFTDEDDGVDPVLPETFLQRLRAMTTGQVKVTLLAAPDMTETLNDESYLGIDHHHQFDDLITELGPLGERVAFTEASFRSHILDRLHEITTPPLTRWVPISLEQPLNDHFEVRINGNTLPEATVRKAGSHLLEVLASSLPIGTPTELTVLSHAIATEQQAIQLARREAMENYLVHLVSRPEESEATIDPAIAARQAAQAEIERQAQEFLRELHERVPAILDHEAVALVESWNQKSIAVLATALTAIPSADLEQILIRLGQNVAAHILSWIRPFEFGESSASRSRCREETATKSRLFYRQFGQLIAPQLQAVRSAVARVVNLNLSSRILFCEGLPDE